MWDCKIEVDSQNLGARKTKGLNRDSQNPGARKPMGLIRIAKIKGS
jgi:hypothetical protein